MTHSNSRGIRAWMMFDWANQPFQTLIVTFIFAPYFVASVVGDPVQGQALWGTATAIGGFATAILAPVVGAVADRTGARKPWIAAFSIPYVIGCLGLWLATPENATPWLALSLFIIAFIGSEFTLLFNNAMLPDLVRGRETGRISGSGWALGYAGGLASLIIVLTLMAPAPGGDKTLIGIAPILGLDPATGEPARATGPLAAIWFIIFALPLFLFTPDAPRRGNLTGAVGTGLRDLLTTLKNLRHHRSLTTYLIASMIYRDALAALFAFGGIYARGVLDWGLFQLGVFGIIAAGTGAIGAWLGGKADHRFGPRPVIRAAIWLLIVVSLTALLTSRESVLMIPVPPNSTLPDIVFFIAGGLLGAGAGILQAASRTLLIDQARGHVDAGQAFGLYALSGKATAFIGPAAIAIATTVTGSQRLGVSPVILLFLIGLFLLRWVSGGTDRGNGTDS
ncbi:MFS transporter [Amaricoccus tamworthensis]|uniref:MFS transporter n=1 Tax=Amaricoccus tamworthensis TaxID=57002 RepID=UPI003C7DED0A